MCNVGKFCLVGCFASFYFRVTELVITGRHHPSKVLP